MTFFTEDRASHVFGVAKLMYNIALKTKGHEYAHDMYLLGLIHDLGYAETNSMLEHPIKGGEVLKEKGYKYWEEVYNHGRADSKYESDELDLLNFADLRINALGETVSFEDRLRDIGVRYGIHSPQYIEAGIIIENIKHKFSIPSEKED